MYISHSSINRLEENKTQKNVIALLKYTKDGTKFMYANGYKYCSYPVLTSFLVYYKEQVLVTSFKTNMKCSICHVSPKDKKSVTCL